MFTRWQWTIFAVLIASSFEQQPVHNETANASGVDLRNDDYEYQYASNWPSLNRTLGSVSAVSFDPCGNVVIFHRGSHVWNERSFNEENRYLPIIDGPITESTVLQINNASGTLICEWGSNYFYMPHGLTIDKDDNYWLTDVALHQVFKFDLRISKTQPVLTLGRRFEPGNDVHSFCKPTSIAVLDNGDFFVADGYCNGRVMKFSSSGRLILQWGKNSFYISRRFSIPAGIVPENFFAIPHSLTYAADKNLLCVADREQGRVQCFHAGNGTFHSMYSNPQIGSRLFSVKYNPRDGGLLFVLNGPQFTFPQQPINGYILSMTTNRIVGRFYPSTPEETFSNPHELAVSGDGDEIYVAELSPTMVHKFKRKNTANVGLGTTTIEQTAMSSNVDSVVESQSLYAGTLTTVSFVVSLIGVSLLIICVSRVICFQPVRRKRFSTRSENISLRNLNQADEAQEEV